MNVHYAKTILLGAIGFSLVASLLSPPTSAYPVFVACNIGISIIMAVSLNLINGYTGQFSLGHAGFMAVGGFTAAKMTLVTSTAIFPLSLVFGGLMAAIVGLIVGVPS